MRSALRTFTFLFLLFFTSQAAAAPSFPPLTGRVVDNAGLLNPASEGMLVHFLSQHEANTTNQVVIVTLENLQGYDIADYGYQLGRHWGIGQEGKDNGVLLIVAPNDRKVRIEVGYGLEGTLTDKLSHDIIQEVILPRFKEGDYTAGILQGTQAILSVLEGSYTGPKPVQKKGSSSSNFAGFFMFALFIVGLLSNIFEGVSSRLRVVFGSVTAVIAGIIAWVFTHEVILALFTAVFVFLMTFFRTPSGGYSGGSSGGSWGSGSGSFGGGSFGGGGGSFGGGGASGSW
ncbi:TPM domain-containing protein [Sulfurimonas sp. HSL3-7]|uniref:TPM domain-containing protein n=1 Tax=Sulfonitrofixus jiaomeiensis TaxID=3131938 RepID=UPI0031F864C1